MKKSKIIALLMATACMATAFVGCSDDEACKHVDANKDGACDVCDVAVVTLTEEVPAAKEEAVDMVVNPLPTEVKISEYIGPKAEDLEEQAPTYAGVQATTAFDDMVIEGNNGNMFKLTKRETNDTAGKIKDIVKIYNAEEDKVVYEFDSGWYTSGSVHNTTTVTLATNYVKAVEEIHSSSSFTVTSKFITNAGDNMVSVDDINTVNVNSAIDGGYQYVTIDNKVYVIDVETAKLVTLEGITNDPAMLVHRPAFTVEKGDFGYVVQGSKVWVYDLTKWVDCIYYNVIPSYWNNPTSMILDNGNMLVQYYKTLPDDAVNYDILQGTTKTDVVQVIVNPVTGEMKEAELGYILAPLYGTAASKYNDNAKNLVTLTPIEDKSINTAAAFEAVIDSELNILYAHKETVVGQNLNEFQYVAENVYVTTVSYGGSSTKVEVVLDGEGKEVTRLPLTTSIFCNRVVVNNKVYSFDMKTELFDLADYASRTSYGDYAILTKVEEVEGVPTTSYYYYNETMSAPVKVGNVVSSNSDYFVVEVEGDTVTYDVYNALNEKIITGAEQIPTFVALSANVWKVQVAADEFVFLRK